MASAKTLLALRMKIALAAQPEVARADPFRGDWAGYLEGPAAAGA
jgi:hypothetical protein